MWLHYSVILLLIYTFILAGKSYGKWLDAVKNYNTMNLSRTCLTRSTRYVDVTSYSLSFFIVLNCFCHTLWHITSSWLRNLIRGVKCLEKTSRPLLRSSVKDHAVAVEFQVPIASAGRGLLPPNPRTVGLASGLGYSSRLEENLWVGYRVPKLSQSDFMNISLLMATLLPTLMWDHCSLTA